MNTKYLSRFTTVKSMKLVTLHVFSLRCVSSNVFVQFRKFSLNIRDKSITLRDDGRSISRNAASLNILVHDMINILCYYSNSEFMNLWLRIYTLFNNLCTRFEISHLKEKDPTEYLLTERHIYSSGNNLINPYTLKMLAKQIQR